MDKQYIVNKICRERNLSFFTQRILSEIFNEKVYTYQNFDGLLYRFENIKEYVLLTNDTILKNFPKEVPNIEITFMTKDACYGLKPEFRQPLIDGLKLKLENLVYNFFFEHINNCVVS